MKNINEDKEIAKGMVILIVDDVPENLEILGSLLSESGFSIGVATSGTQAIKAATAKTPDLILMDVSMPEMDGYTACRKLKENPGTDEIPVIFLTAHTEEQEIIKGFEAGGVDYVTKPFKPMELIRRIMTHVELKKAKEWIEKQNEELLEMNFKLSRSERHLRNLNEMKDKFFSIIAHDLKSPIATFRQIMKVLINPKYTPDDSKKEDLLLDMYQSATKLNELLDNILTWARSQTGQIMFAPDIDSIIIVVNEVLSSLSSIFTQKKITCHNHIKPEIDAWFDKNMLSTILRNLISNAAKFTPEGGTIDISAEYTGEFVEITVSDTGIGINMEDISKLFRIDIHPNSIGSTGEKGTGLGLILCKEFVEKHGGIIKVVSTKGEGSIFSFTLPKSSRNTDEN